MTDRDIITFQDGIEVERTSFHVPDEQLAVESLGKDIDSYIETAKKALDKWDTLTAAQKDTILKFLLKFVIREFLTR